MEGPREGGIVRAGGGDELSVYQTKPVWANFNLHKRFSEQAPAIPFILFNEMRTLPLLGLVGRIRRNQDDNPHARAAQSAASQWPWRRRRMEIARPNGGAGRRRSHSQHPHTHDGLTPTHRDPSPSQTCGGHRGHTRTRRPRSRARTTPEASTGPCAFIPTTVCTPTKATPPVARESIKRCAVTACTRQRNKTRAEATQARVDPCRSPSPNHTQSEAGRKHKDVKVPGQCW